MKRVIRFSELSSIRVSVYLTIFLLLILYFPLLLQAQECGEVELTSQMAIDNFHCTSVGSLAVREALDGDITNLDGLSGVTGVYSLTIADNEALTNIDGLGGLTGYVLKVVINNNKTLTNID